MNGRIAQQCCWQGSDADTPSGSPRIQPQVCPRLGYTAVCCWIALVELLLPCCCYRHSGHADALCESRILELLHRIAWVLPTQRYVSTLCVALEAELTDVACCRVRAALLSMR